MFGNYRNSSDMVVDRMFFEFSQSGKLAWPRGMCFRNRKFTLKLFRPFVFVANANAFLFTKHLPTTASFIVCVTGGYSVVDMNY